MARVLLVEDHGDWRRLLTGVLRRHGDVVVSTDSRSGALAQLAGRRKLDLAIVDLYLGGVPHGMEICREASSLNVPVIAISGPAIADEVRTLFKECGVTDFVTKNNFDEAGFALKVNKILQRNLRRAEPDAAMKVPEVSIVVQNIVSLTQTANYQNIMNLVDKLPMSEDERLAVKEKTAEVLDELSRDKPDRNKVSKAVSWIAGRSWEVFLQLIPKILETPWPQGGA
jgi:CheY-like chemotaxis protein